MSRLKQSIKDVNGYDVEISTSKDHRSIISCCAQFGTMEKGDGYSSFQYMIHSDPFIVLAKSAPGKRATENALREIHAAGMIEFNRRREAGELPTREAATEVQPGQIVFLDSNYPGKSNVAIYERLSRDKFKAVDLDTLELVTVEHLKPYSKKFGIGWYYHDGPELETLPLDEVMIKVEEAKTATAERNRIKNEQAENAAKERAAKIEAGRPLVNIPAAAIGVICAFMQEDKSDPQSDYFGSSTQRTIYLAYTSKEREDFKEMRAAALNCPEVAHMATLSPDDEHRDNYTGGNGFWLGEHRYHGWQIKKVTYNWNKMPDSLYIAAAEGRFFCKDIAAEPEPQALNTGNVQIIDYSEKSIAVIGDTKPIKDKLGRYGLGGVFNPRLTCGPGWIFPKTKFEAVRDYLLSLQGQTVDPKQGLKDEIKKTVQMFAETDLRNTGAISDETKAIAEIQNIDLSEAVEVEEFTGAFTE
jgi:hypothetical protein